MTTGLQPYPYAPRRRIVRRRKQGLALFVSCALRAACLLGRGLFVLLLVCGVLYIREHTLPEPAAADPGGSNLTGATNSNGTPAPVSDPQGGTTGAHTVWTPGTDASTSALSGNIVIDPGHGGIQPGCEIQGTLEKDITMQVSLLLREQLQKAGLTVWMTRSGDQDVSLEDRCQFANELKADLFISIHCNSYEDPSICGLETFWYRDTRCEAFARKVLQTAAARSIQTHGVRKENYQVLRDTEMPATLVEIGYMTCPEELRWLETPDYQQRLAEAIAEGIIQTMSPATT